MKISYSEIEQFLVAYQELQDTKMPVKLSFKLQKLVKFVAPGYNEYTQKLQVILEKYAEKSANGKFKYDTETKNVVFKEGMEDECAEALLTLQQEETELKGEYSAITLDELDSFELSPKQLSALASFIAEYGDVKVSTWVRTQIAHTDAVTLRRKTKINARFIRNLFTPSYNFGCAMAA